jgi:hypothetical protein
LARELVRVVRPGGSVTITTPAHDLRIFPARLTPWAHRRWGHDVRTGYTEDRLRQLFSAAGAPDVDIRRLRARMFLWLYCPLSVLARTSDAIGRAAFRLAATCDSRWNAEGPNGFLLASVRVPG